MFEGVLTPFCACCADLILSHMGLLFVVVEFEPATGANRNTMDARASFPAADGAHSRQCFGAGKGNRTLILSLEGFCITTMLCPHSTVTGQNFSLLQQHPIEAFWCRTQMDCRTYRRLRRSGQWKRCPARHSIQMNSSCGRSNLP